METSNNRFLLLYASQTGQAKAIAEEIAERASEHELYADIHCISETERKFWLERERCVVIVSSSTGEGDPPDTALKFVRRIRKKTLPDDHFMELQFTILGLGDTNYTNFCNCPKSLNKRLLELGASHFYPPDWADDAVGLEIVADPWIDGLFPALREHFGLPAEVEITANPLLFGTRITNSTYNPEKSTPATPKEKQTEHTVPSIINGDINNKGMDLNVEKNKAMDSMENSKENEVVNVSDDKIKDADVATGVNIKENIKEAACVINTYIKENIKDADNVINTDMKENIKDADNAINTDIKENVKDADNALNTDMKENIKGADCLKSMDTAEKSLSDNNTAQGYSPNISSQENGEKHLSQLFESTLVLTPVLSTESGTGSLVCSVPPLSEQHLSVPANPARYLSLRYLEQSINTKEIMIQNGAAFPSSASEMQFVPIVSAFRMTSECAVKTALKLTLDISDCPWSYEPGDSIGIVCPNTAEEVNCLLHRLDLQQKADCACALELMTSSGKKNPKLPEYIPTRCTLRYALEFCLDMRSVPKKAFLRALAEHTPNTSESRRLLELCSRQGSEHYTSFVRTPGCGLLDLLAAFPSCQPPVEMLFEHLPRLNARAYSAASCQEASPGRLDIVFNIVEIPAGKGRAYNRQGICTGYLNRITQELQKRYESSSTVDGNSFPLPQVGVFLRTNQLFRAPVDLESPFIMIGPGTGVAPFVGFLQQREHRLRQSQNASAPGVTWLFYGCRHQDNDFLFKDELTRLHTTGVLNHLVTCFSRDSDESPEKPRYVQDSLRLHQEQVLELLSKCESSLVYVCGDAKGMAKDVHSTFIKLLQEEKGMSEKDAQAFMFQLRFNKRYHEDVWT